MHCSFKYLTIPVVKCNVQTLTVPVAVSFLINDNVCMSLHIYDMSFLKFFYSIAYEILPVFREVLTTHLLTLYWKLFARLIIMQE